MDKKYIIGIGCIVLVAIVAIVASMGGGDNISKDSDASTDSENVKKLNISNLKISSSGYGGYDITATLVPDKDYSYLEMVVVWYDSSDAIIDKSPLVWNMNDVPEGQTIKISGDGYVSGDNTPVKAKVYLFDSVFSGGDLSDAIYSKTVEI
jgi:hypothetical protein